MTPNILYNLLLYVPALVFLSICLLTLVGILGYAFALILWLIKDPDEYEGPGLIRNIVSP